jgi:hypothetical protein
VIQTLRGPFGAGFATWRNLPGRSRGEGIVTERFRWWLASRCASYAVILMQSEMTGADWQWVEEFAAALARHERKR